MGIAVAPIAAEQRSTRCRICGRVAPRGAKLCGQCVAAVKRARQVPTLSSHFLPLTTARPTSIPAKVAMPQQSQSRVGRLSGFPAAAGGWGVIVAFATFGVAVCLTGYFAVQEIDGAADAAGPAPAASIGAAATALQMPATARGDPAMAVAPTLRDEAMPPVGGAVAPPAAPASSAPKVGPRARATESRTTKAAVDTGDARPSSRIGEGEVLLPATEPGNPTPVAVNDAPAPNPDASAPPDRGEALRAALARCSGEGFLAGIVCSERARLQYCEGFWGQVPQCRGAARTDSSR